MQKRHEVSRGALMIRISAIVGILACIVDIGVVCFLETRFPGYKPIFQTMSDLGHEGSPVAAIISTWWIAMGLMFILFGYGFYECFRHLKKARTAGILLALYGIGEGLGSGLIPGAPGNIFDTPNSLFHNLLSGIGLLAAMLLPFVVMKMFDERQSTAYWISWLTTVFGIFFFLLFAISNFYHREGYWISYLGIWQRLYTFSYFLYFIYLASLMLINRGKQFLIPE